MNCVTENWLINQAKQEFHKFNCATDPFDRGICAGELMAYGQIASRAFGVGSEPHHMISAMVDEMTGAVSHD